MRFYKLKIEIVPFLQIFLKIFFNGGEQNRYVSDLLDDEKQISIILRSLNYEISENFHEF